MRDFREYAKLEAFNVVAVPGVVVFIVPPNDTLEFSILTIAILACASFLIVGALYWWAKDKRLKRSDRQAMPRVLSIADRVEKPLLLLTGLALLAVVYGVVTLGFTGTVIGAIILVALAVLEYVNYYHYQLMNFDQKSDFLRLIRTRSLRRAHLARDLAGYRAKRRA